MHLKLYHTIKCLLHPLSGSWVSFLSVIGLSAGWNLGIVELEAWTCATISILFWKERIQGNYVHKATIHKPCSSTLQFMIPYHKLPQVDILNVGLCTLVHSDVILTLSWRSGSAPAASILSTTWRWPQREAHIKAEKLFCSGESSDRRTMSSTLVQCWYTKKLNSTASNSLYSEPIFL